MHSVERFKVVRSQREPMPEIVLASRDGASPLTIEAAQLIAQYEVAPNTTLLVLDEDCPFEEQLHLVLVKGDDASDHIVIGVPYATGVFALVEQAERTLRFRFANDGVWVATVHAKATLLPPRLPRGAKRAGRLLGPHHLTLSFEEDRK